MKKAGYVSIIGRPNAGKSTLLNRVLGTELSVVTPKAQTTRDRVLGILTEPEQGQIVFIDTPGVHQAKEGGINAYMMSEAREALVDTSCVWYLIDPHYHGERTLKHELVVLDLLKNTTAPVYILINKMDSLRVGKAMTQKLIGGLEDSIKEEAISRGILSVSFFRISAKEGDGVDELLKATWATLSEGEYYYPDEDQLSDRPSRFFVAEKIREQLFLQLGDELPYCCAVKIESFDENARPPRIEATVFVERDSQKGMVIGSGAQKIKAVGQAARAQIEKFLGHPVFLGLKVDVYKNWTRDAEAMRRLGYVLPDRKKSK